MEQQIGTQDDRAHKNHVESKQRTGARGGGEGAISNVMVGKVSTEKMTFGQRLEGGKSWGYLDRNVPGKGAVAQALSYAAVRRR